MPPLEDDGTEDEEDDHADLAGTKCDTSSVPLTPLANGHGNGDDEDDDARFVVVSEDASIDVEWGTKVKLSHPHLDWDDLPDFSFLPRRHAIARTRLLARHTALLPKDVDVRDEVSTTRELAREEAAALTLVEAALALATASPTANADPDATPPDEEAEPVAAAINKDAEVKVEGEGEAVSEEEAEDALDAETDLQPPQRAEALDILAGMFAILREHIYIDKMEEIAAEEAMIINGTPTELLTTLSQRKEHCPNLASLRRDCDKEWTHKKRKADEDAIWSWWRVQKDGLRDDMVADEASGKRRKLEREKRSLDNRVNGTPTFKSYSSFLCSSNAHRFVRSEESVYSRRHPVTRVLYIYFDWGIEPECNLLVSG